MKQRSPLKSVVAAPSQRGYTAFDAFENQLRGLCLKEYPCGAGSWRTSQEENVQSSKYLVTLRDYGSGVEPVESLKEIVHTNSLPWAVEVTWSDEAKELRELAVRSPQKITPDFIYRHFRTLRITNQAVTELDKNILKFKNLEQLVLSANKISSVDSRYLPRNLQVLELCANSITDLYSLCTHPPPLTHLGLGYNRIIELDDYIRGTFWPRLLSLDLSHNDLQDLVDVMEKISTLPSLKSLLLTGNPVSISPGYRGYIVDCLPNLAILDDSRISADERHNFSGLRLKNNCIRDETKITLEAIAIRGLPVPEEIRAPDDQPDYPVVSRKYAVHFLFPQDPAEAVGARRRRRTESIVTEASDSKPATAQLPQASSPGFLAARNLTQQKTDAGRNGEVPKNGVNGVGAATPTSSDSRTVVTPKGTVALAAKWQRSARNVSNPSSKNGRASEPSAGVKTNPQGKYETVPVKTDGRSWAEEIELNWSKEIVRDDLLVLRNFMRNGMEVQIVEEKVCSYPADQVAGYESKSPSASRAPVAGGKLSTKKGEKGGKDGRPGDGKPGASRRKKGEEVDLVAMPPEFSVVASFRTNLKDFLDGEFEIELVYCKDGDQEEVHRVTVKESEGAGEKSKKDQGRKKDKDKDGSGGKDKDKKGKGGGAGGSEGGAKKGRVGEKVGATPGSGAAAKGSAGAKTPKDKGGKDKGGTASDMQAIEEENRSVQPLECHLRIRLFHWLTLQDSLIALKKTDLTQESAGGAGTEGGAGGEGDADGSAAAASAAGASAAAGSG